MTNRRLTLTITSLLAILLFALHFADDIARGFEEGNLFDFTGILLTAAWLYAVLALAHRRGGLAIIFVFSILAAGVPAIHMRGAGLSGGRLAHTDGVLFFAFTLIALGATGIVSAILAAQEWWQLRPERR